MVAARTEETFARVAIVVLVVVVLAPLLMMAFAMPMMGLMGWRWGIGIPGGISPLWGLGMMLVWLLLLVGLGYVGYRALVGGLRSSSRSDSAVEELRLAYARGDLTDDEFERRRERLQETQRE